MKIQIKNKDQLLDNWIWLFTVLYLTLICVLNSDSWGSLVMFGCSGVVFVLSAIKASGKVRLKIGYYHVYWLMFGAYAFISCLWALSPESATTQASTIIKLLICTALMYIYYQDETDLWRLYNAIRWSGFAVCLYTIVSVGINTLMIILMSGKRLEVYFANINTVGILSAFAVVITIYELFFKKLNIIALLMIVPCALIIAASGTKKALLIVLMGCCILLYYRYKSKNALKSVIRFAIIGIALILAISVIASLPMFSGIIGRMESFVSFFTGEGKVDNSTFVRNEMIQVGLEKFAAAPLFGIGIGSSGKYLSEAIGLNTYFHNNYVEILCCGGIVGFAIYYSLWAYCLWKLLRRRNSPDHLIKLGLTLVIIFLAMDMARVTYYSKTTFFYTMVFFLHVKSSENSAAKDEI